MVNLEDVRALALAHPRVQLVVAHSGWGGRDARGIDDLAHDCPNVWFDTAGVNMPTQIRHLVDIGVGRRVMFGSDYPFLHPRVELLRVELADLADDVLAGVLGDNAARLLEA
jgi:predicted TIM-barrel fold metal-dependent hydrolase